MTDFVFVSWGNDSVALLQWLRERDAESFTCVFSDTGWAAPWWLERIEQGEEFARRCGYEVARLPSVGMQRLVQLRKGWPSNQYQFCTEELKIKPALGYMDERDPNREAVCVLGVRREESRRRATFPEHVEESERHGGRDLWAPLVRVLTPERDELVRRAGFDVLSHRSMECYPCVNANRSDLRQLTDERVSEIEEMETAMGFTSKGKPRTMFRPGRFRGAVGIREVKRWADSERGAYEPPTAGCDSGWCGT